ncbi:odorant receptor 4-like [Culex pipiens pallens]|uniref:odorant receptor 4-like n=1 Tax=Culex pipiens pallens TaxID=42434 RepID=UPI0022AB07A5|nr:odorant receptor 4-like [Culex pipiens pallens]
MNIVTVTTIVNICMVSAFNLLPIAEMIVQGAQTGTWHQELPYQIWFPWDSLTGWSYPLMYAFQIYSGLIVVIGNVNLNIGTTAFHGCKPGVNSGGINNEIGKCLVLIIMRTQKPFQLTAWKFWPLNITSFSKIINASWSYFSLLNALLKK